MVLSEEVFSSHSTSTTLSSTDLVHRDAKSIGITNLNPPINVSLNSSIQDASTTKYQRPSFKKIDSTYSNMTTNKYLSKKEVTVITPNTTDASANVADNQLLINVNVSAINHTENFNINETNYNQSLHINSEKVIEKDLGMPPGNLSAAGIAGITLGCAVIVGIICAVSYFLYRNRGFNRPQVLNDRCSNPDSSGYIDDASVRVSSYYFYLICSFLLFFY